MKERKLSVEEIESLRRKIHDRSAFRDMVDKYRYQIAVKVSRAQLSFEDALQHFNGDAASLQGTLNEIWRNHHDFD